MTVITILSGRESVLIFQDILNIHLSYDGCQISLMRETWKHTSVLILKTLGTLILQKNSYMKLYVGLPYTAHNWEFRMTHERGGFLVKLLGHGQDK